MDGRPAGTITAGRVAHIELEPGAAVRLTVEPAGRSIDVGAGAGATLEREFTAGLCGVVLDGRNRPLRTPASTEEQIVERDAVMAELGLAVS